MVSRLIVIMLAFGAAIYRLSHGAVVEAAGLAALGGGLLLLRAARNRAAFRYGAVACFLITAGSIVIVIVRDYL